MLRAFNLPWVFCTREFTILLNYKYILTILFWGSDFIINNDLEDRIIKNNITAQSKVGFYSYTFNLWVMYMLKESFIFFVSLIYFFWKCIFINVLHNVWPLKSASYRKFFYWNKYEIVRMHLFLLQNITEIVQIFVAKCNLLPVKIDNILGKYVNCHFYLNCEKYYLKI